MSEQRNDQQMVDTMEAVWQSIDGLCAGLSETQWKTVTDCPGWSVQDQLSHLAGSENGLLGRPRPDHTVPTLTHIKNDVGANNEIVVDYRRPWSGAQVLEDFRETTGERLKVLRAMGPGDFDAAAQTPIGPGTQRDYLAIRIFDAWVHEQDMRRALGIPGDLDGPVAEHSVGRMAMAVPYIVGRKVQPPDGTTVVVEVTGGEGRVLPVAMQGARANPLDSVPESPDARLSMDVETFLCLCCGRWDPAGTIESGRVQISGDRALGESIAREMNIMI